jgi:hypothetical protein
MDVIINYSAGKPQDSRTECEAKRRMEYTESSILDAVSSFEAYCIEKYPQGSQIVVTSIKIEI